MPQDRFFTEKLEKEVTLLDEEAHHLFVMRKKIGDQVELVDGKNHLATATIIGMEKKRAVLKIDSLITATPSYPIILAQAIPKLNKLDFIVEKGTELGATAFWLFPADKSEKREVKDLERLKRIAIAAMKQCGRLDLPEIMVKKPLHNWQEWPYPSYYGDISGASISKVWKQDSGTLFLIGPEAGFSERELLFLKKMKVQPVKLHHNILRTETASLAALTIIETFL